MQFKQLTIKLLWTLSLIPIIFLNCQKEPESDAIRFNRVASTIFKDVYPAIAEEILEKYQITEGSCYDLGCGPGYLAIEMAKHSNLMIYGLDIDPEAVQIAIQNVTKTKLSDRIHIDQGDVHQMPYWDNSADLIVSRGSVFFWKDRVQAFKEVMRVLKPGGIAYIGGGMGRKMSREQKTKIKDKLKNQGFFPGGKVKVSRFMMEESLIIAGIKTYKIHGDGPGDAGCKCGMWVEIRKPIKD